MNLIDQINNIDIWLLLKINSHHTPWLDFIMFQASGRFTWIPFYILIITLLIKQYKKDSILIILFAFITIALSDQISVHLFKNVFLRLRPCHNPALEGSLHLVNNACGGMYGFVSSHAANSFSVLFFLTPQLKNKIPYLWWSMIAWAVLLCYCRIYLGVHYPFDVLCGAMIGSVIGLLTYQLMRYIRVHYYC